MRAQAPCTLSEQNHVLSTWTPAPGLLPSTWELVNKCWLAKFILCSLDNTLCDIDGPAMLWLTLDLQFDPDWRLKFKLYAISTQQKGSHLTLFRRSWALLVHTAVFLRSYAPWQRVWPRRNCQSPERKVCAGYKKSSGCCEHLSDSNCKATSVGQHYVNFSVSFQVFLCPEVISGPVKAPLQGCQV